MTLAHAGVQDCNDLAISQILRSHQGLIIHEEYVAEPARRVQSFLAVLRHSADEAEHAPDGRTIALPRVRQ